MNITTELSRKDLEAMLKVFIQTTDEMMASKKGCKETDLDKREAAIMCRDRAQNLEDLPENVRKASMTAWWWLPNFALASINMGIPLFSLIDKVICYDDDSILLQSVVMSDGKVKEVRYPAER